jgi:hypothetical protein
MPRGNKVNLRIEPRKWKSGETQAVRIPKVLVDKVLEYARQLDEEYVKIDESSVRSD